MVIFSLKFPIWAADKTSNDRKRKIRWTRRESETLMVATLFAVNVVVIGWGYLYAWLI